jgi:hypothetical protein
LCRGEPLSEFGVDHFPTETDYAVIDNHTRIFDSMQAGHLSPCARRAPLGRGKLANIRDD